MENQKNDNLNLLEAVVQNTEMGKNTLEQIVPMTDDVQFKAELLRQRNVYHQLNQEAHTAIEACGGTAQGQTLSHGFARQEFMDMIHCDNITGVDVHRKTQWQDRKSKSHRQNLKNFRRKTSV